MTREEYDNKQHLIDLLEQAELLQGRLFMECNYEIEVTCPNNCLQDEITELKEEIEPWIEHFDQLDELSNRGDDLYQAQKDDY